MMSKIVLLLYISLLYSLLCVSGSINIEFSGFTEGGNYIYYTNGNNLITELTCNASEADSRDSSISTTWFYESGNNKKINSDSNVLQFEDVATGLQWGETRNYFCKAKYRLNGQLQHKDSKTIAVSIAYNTTITVSYESTTHIIGIKNHNVILIPVMTENVQLSCDAEAAEWYYYPRNHMPQSRQNPLTLDVYTREFTTLFYCTNTNSTTPRHIFHTVRLHSIGSGIWLQQHNTYTKMTEKGIVTLTEDRTVVCVSSEDIQYAAWYFRGEVNEGEGELVNDTIEHNISQGFLKLILPTSLPTSRTGYYYCSTSEYTNYTNTRNREHSIRVSLPPTITTTEVYSTPIISLQLFYTPDYEIVFVGVDDVIVTCIVINDHNIELNVSLIDVIDGNLLKREISNEGRIQLDQRIESVRGILTYMCTAVTEIGIMEESLITVQTEDIYTQEVINVQTDINPVTQELILLQWETSHPLLANETFIIWLSRVNVSSEYEVIATTQNTEYSLFDLSYNYHYSIRVQVVSRLNTTHTDIYYIHTDRMGKTFQYTTVVGIVVVLIVLLLAVIAVIILLVLLVLKRRKMKYGYSKQTKQSSNNSSEKDKYIILSDIHVPDSPLNVNQLPVITSKKPYYKPLSSIPNTSIEERDEYMTVEQLDSELDLFGRETDSGLEEISSQTYEQQYENVREKLYQSTNMKYLHDPNAALVPLSEYKNHLNRLLCEFRMEKEYRALGGQDLRYDCDIANLSVNSYKNKYKMIYPYDSSRVVLTSHTDSDYINATFIPGFHLSDTFIASQAPKKNTVGEFWQMILEQRITTIVMLTRVVELGKEKSITYWPMVPGTSETHGRVNVSLQKEQQFTGYTVRELVMTGFGSRTILTQFHYTAWPDHDVPQLFNNLLDFTEIVKQHRKQERAPVLVHCSAGVGRSGTFICLYNLLEAVRVGEPVSVYRIVNEMREHRPQMVQTFNQYKFIYLSLLELIFGSTATPSKDFCEKYKEYLLSQSDTQTDIFKEEFKELTYQSDCSFNHLQTSARDPSNVDKNVVRDVLPYDMNRVILYSPKWSCEYINASYMEGYELIATQLPTSHTIQDYLQLIYQLQDPLVVLLFTQNEYRQVRSGISERVCYWLEEPGIKEFENFTVKTEKSRKSSSLLQQKMKVFSNYDNDDRPFTQYISIDWYDEEGNINEIVAILTLLDLILKQKQSSAGKNIVFCCSDGISKSGVLLTVYNAIRGIQSSQSIDVFQSVKQLRNYRKNMVPSMEHYLSCYQLINEYCQMNV